MTQDIIFNIFEVLGGLGLFLFGMKIMSEGLQNIAGDRLRTILERATSNHFLGILVGTIVTFITNSSSATTIMVVGFINSGLMNLSQALGVIMGANIGTTLTTQMISFKIDAIAPLFIFIGILMNMFFKKQNIKKTGHIILGFGILFFGITVMGAPLEEFARTPAFESLLTTFENPLLALLAGLIFTAVIQSSSATTGLLVAMNLGGVNLPFKTAAFIILGSNIGTCSDSLIASIPANRESKRAAVGNIFFKVTGSLVFGSLIIAFPGILTWIQKIWPDGARQIAMFHSLFNICTVILFFPFIKQFVAIMQKLIPLKTEEINNNERKLIYLNPSILQTSTLAVTNSKLEFCRMGKMVYDNLQLALDAFYNKDSNKASKVIETEGTINYLNHQITVWLVRIQSLSLSVPDGEKLSMMLKTISDVERIGDHAENIAEYTMLVEKYGTKISLDAIKELNELSEITMKSTKLALEIFETRDESRLSLVDVLEKETDNLAKEYIENNIRRLKDKVCDPRSGIVFTDMVTDLERCADHAMNIAYSIMGETTWDSRRNKILRVSIDNKKKINKSKRKKK